MRKTMFLVLISLSLVISGCFAENSIDKEKEVTENLDLVETSTVENIESNQELDLSESSKAQDLYNKIDNTMHAIERKYDFSGAVYVGMEGEGIYSKTFGMADYDQDIPNTLDTKFIMASLTKQFTAAAILLLEERGLLELDHQVTDYFPEATQWEGITIHHLLSMSSGIVNTGHPNLVENFEKSFGSNITSLPPTVEFIALYNDIPLNFKPGERYEYSNSNYFLLGLIIEQISGDTYETFLEKNIFEPLGMFNSGYSIDWDIQENKAIGYEKIITENDVYPIQYDEYFLFHAAGGLYTTMNDLVTWDRALYSDKLLKKETIDKMYVPYTKIPSNSDYGSGYEYGYGWLTQENIVEHAGYLPGYLANIYRELDSELVIIILSNNQYLGGNKISSFTNTLTNIVKGE